MRALAVLLLLSVGAATRASSRRRGTLSIPLVGDLVIAPSAGVFAGDLRTQVAARSGRRGRTTSRRVARLAESLARRAGAIAVTHETLVRHARERPVARAVLDGGS